jgi:phosphoglycolate phosphatase
LIVFDLDGTLVDSRRDLAIAVNLMLQEWGAAPLAEANVTSMVGEGARVLVDRALAATGLPLDEAPRALSRFLEIYDGHLLDHTRPYRGIPELLDHLQPLATLSVLTNKPTRASKRVLDGVGLIDRFVAVIGGDSEFPRKPDPTALLHLAGTYASGRDQVVMVGDSRIDVETAKAAKVRCCLVRYGFGFPEDPLPEDVLIAETPDALATLCLQLLHKDQ